MIAQVRTHGQTCILVETIPCQDSKCEDAATSTYQPERPLIQGDTGKKKKKKSKFSTNNIPGQKSTGTPKVKKQQSKVYLLDQNNKHHSCTGENTPPALIYLVRCRILLESTLIHESTAKSAQTTADTEYSYKPKQLSFCEMKSNKHKIFLQQQLSKSN